MRIFDEVHPAARQERLRIFVPTWRYVALAGQLFIFFKFIYTYICENFNAYHAVLSEVESKKQFNSVFLFSFSTCPCKENIKWSSERIYSTDERVGRRLSFPLSALLHIKEPEGVFLLWLGVGVGASLQITRRCHQSMLRRSVYMVVRCFICSCK